MIRLLIADDEKLEREALADMVSRRFEHEVVLELAENGRKAADTAVLWGADLILMDIEMPGMSGLDAARAVLAQRPACRVIFVTAYSLFQYAHEAVHLGEQSSHKTVFAKVPAMGQIWRDSGHAFSFASSSSRGIYPSPSYLIWMCCTRFPLDLSGAST